jgi:hypothetical protein
LRAEWYLLSSVFLGIFWVSLTINRSQSPLRFELTS